MKNKITLFFLISVILLSFTVSSSSISFEAPEFEWMVKVGDSMTYYYTKYFDLYDSDKNGDMYSRIYSTTTSEGEPVNIFLKKGLIIKAVIWELGLIARIYISLNGIATGMDEIESLYFFEGDILQKTVNNRAYWENKSVQNTDTTSFPDRTITDSEFVQGDYFVQSFNMTANSGEKLLRIRKTNWKTGWFISLNERYSNETHLIREFEISTETQGLFTNLDLGRIIIPVAFLLALLTIIIIGKRRIHGF